MLFSEDFEYRSASKTVLALGTFDGVHLGHRAVIGQAVSIAKSLGAVPAVWCFSAPPKGEESLIPLDEKKTAMAALGVECVVCPPFSDAVKNLSPERFFEDVIVGKMRAAHVVCGFNYTFGKGGKGNAELLRSLCEKSGVGLTVVPPVRADGDIVSSTRIRKLLAQNETEKANRLLGKK